MNITLPFYQTPDEGWCCRAQLTTEYRRLQQNIIPNDNNVTNEHWIPVMNDLDVAVDT